MRLVVDGGGGATICNALAASGYVIQMALFGRARVSSIKSRVAFVAGVLLGASAIGAASACVAAAAAGDSLGAPCD